MEQKMFLIASGSSALAAGEATFTILRQRDGAPRSTRVLPMPVLDARGRPDLDNSDNVHRPAEPVCKGRITEAAASDIHRTHLLVIISVIHCVLDDVSNIDPHFGDALELP